VAERGARKRMFWEESVPSKNHKTWGGHLKGGSQNGTGGEPSSKIKRGEVHSKAGKRTKGGRAGTGYGQVSLRSARQGLDAGKKQGGRECG